MSVTTSPPGPRAPCPFAVVAPTPFYSPGGCSARILGEIAGLPKTLEPPTVFTYGTGEEIPGVRTVRAGPSIPGFTGGFHWSRPVLDALVSESLLRRSSLPRSLHVHLHEGGLIGRLVRKLRGRPYIADLQGSLVEEALRYAKSRVAERAATVLSRVERLAESGASFLVTSSPSMEQYVRSRLPQLRDRVVCIEDGIPSESILSREDRRRYRQQARADLPDPENAFVVAYVGTLSPSQGVDSLLAAAPGILQAVPNARFRVYGPSNREFSIQGYAEVAGRLGLGSRVQFLGAVPYDRVTQTLAGADVAVTWKTNPFEANGKVAAYMAAGVPTVAIRSPAVQRYLGAGGEKGGLVVEDVDHAAEAVIRLAHDQSLREQLGESASATARAELSWVPRSETILGLHRQIIAS